MNRSYMQDRMDDMLVQADEMQTTIDTMTRMIALMERDERDHALHGGEDPQT